MKIIDKRIAALEENLPDKTPYIAWQYGDVRPEIPADIGDRKVMIIRWVIVEPPVRDTDDKIIEPAKPWDGNDARYLEMRKDHLARERADARPFDPAFQNRG